MTLAENVSLPLQLYTSFTPAEVRDIVAYKLALVGLAGYQEGISCIACHSIVETDVQGNANYTLLQPRRYAFELEAQADTTSAARCRPPSASTRPRRCTATRPPPTSASSDRSTTSRCRRA